MIRQQDETLQESAWNMAVAYMIRLDNIIKDMNYYSSIGNNFDWWKSCCALYRELYGKMTKTMLDMHIGFFNKMLNQIRIINHNALVGYKKADYSILFIDLHKWDVSLRKTMEELKLVSPSKDDPGKALR